MSVLQRITSSAKLLVAGIGLITTFFTVVDFMMFLSYPNEARKNFGDESSWSWQLFVDMLLLSMFILPHSFFAHKTVKELFFKCNVQDIQRSVYIIATCGTLQLLTKNWCRTHDYYFWSFNLQNKLTFAIFVLVHVFFWLVIYIGCICMDVNELLGLKQVYYSIQKLPEPLKCKSIELQRLYSHMRHPSFLAFSIILWFVPIMSLDRFLLAFILTAYMFLAWKTDETDYRYQKVQYSRKFCSGSL